MKIRRIEVYLFEPFQTVMFGWANNEEGFEIMLGVFAIVFIKS